MINAIAAMAHFNWRNTALLNSEQVIHVRKKVPHHSSIQFLPTTPPCTFSHYNFTVSAYGSGVSLGLYARGHKLQTHTMLLATMERPATLTRFLA